MGVFLLADGDGWSHAGVALGLWVGNVLFACLVHVVVFTGEGWEALAAWSFVLAVDV